MVAVISLPINQNFNPPLSGQKQFWLPTVFRICPSVSNGHSVVTTHSKSHINTLLLLKTSLAISHWFLFLISGIVTGPINQNFSCVLTETVVNGSVMVSDSLVGGFIISNYLYLQEDLQQKANTLHEDLTKHVCLVSLSWTISSTLMIYIIGYLPYRFELGSKLNKYFLF